MTRGPVTAVVCGLAAGCGAWATGAAIDRTLGPDGPVRVAMLPSAAWLAGASLAGVVVALIAYALLTTIGTRETARDSVYVLTGGALLVLPYLPWVADVFPALMLLAGPGALILWGILITLFLWTAVLHTRRAWLARHPPPATPLPHHSGESIARRRRWTLAILLASLVSSGLVAERFTRTVLFPGGDEPHYLVIAQSLWRDGDLRIENNHQRADYEEYFHRPLAPHYLTRGVDRQIYSIHPIGMPVLMTPVYAMGGYDLVVWALVLLGAITMAVAWRLAWAVTGSASAATFGWAVIALGAPWIFNTFAVYPEVPAACATMLAFSLTTGWHASHAHRTPNAVPAVRWWLAGIAIACLPWLSTKYVVMAAALGAVSLARAWLPLPADAAARTRATTRTLAVVLPNIVSLALWFGFFKWIWGTFSPGAPYGSQRETRLEYLPAGGPGLLFDQEYGIVVFAPALLMVLPGLWALYRQRGGRRRLSVEIVVVFASLLAVVGAFHIWWGGSAVVGRPLVSGLPLLLLPIAAHRAACAEQPLRRAAQRTWLCIGVALTVLMATAQQGFLLVAGRDGSSQVLEYLAPSTPVWTTLPSFLRQPPTHAWLAVLAWGGMALAAGVLLGRVRRHRRGPGADHAMALAAVVLAMAGVSSMLAAMVPPSTPATDLRERSRVRLLDAFDADRRPLAIRYDPLTRLDPARVPELFPIVVREAGDRSVDRATQLFGRRLSLPAGTYGVDLVFPAGVPAVSGQVALHAGRTGAPLQTWDVVLTPPGSWGRAFSLPVDVGFVGIRASADVVHAAPQVRVTPQRIVDASARPQTPAVLGSARYGDDVVLVHGEDAWPERDGLWVRGRATAILTIVRDVQPLTLSLRAGPVPVTVRLDWGGSSSEVRLTAGQEQEIVLPAATARAQQLRVTSSNGFVPAEIEPGSRDRRVLGCWLRLVAPDRVR